MFFDEGQIIQAIITSNLSWRFDVEMEKQSHGCSWAFTKL